MHRCNKRFFTFFYFYLNVYYIYDVMHTVSQVYHTFVNVFEQILTGNKNSFIGTFSSKFATRKCAVDYYTTAYRRSETEVAYGGATWRVMFEKMIGLLSSVPPLPRWRVCVPIQVCPLLIRTLSEVDKWKTVHPSAKVT